MDDAGWEWAEDSERRRFEDELREGGILDKEFIAWVADMEYAIKHDEKFRRQVDELGTDS